MNKPFEGKLINKIPYLALIALSLVNARTFAALPTPNSDPLPSYQETLNSDVVITEKVQKKISHNINLKNQPVSAAAHQGVVVLQGSVSSKYQAELAIKLAKSVPGVKAVKSQLTIRAKQGKI